MMKTRLVLLLVLWTALPVSSQVINSSFETVSGPDLTSWEWTCGAQSFNSAPPDGGQWCIKVWGGNTQGCFPGYAYQRLPGVTGGIHYLLSCWAHAEMFPVVGIYFGTLNHGVITLHAGDTTTSTTWTYLSKQSSFALSPGDTPVVVLHGGQAGGPVQCYGYFDLVSLQVLSGILFPDQDHGITVTPNPVRNTAIIHTDVCLENATLMVWNATQQAVQEIHNLSGSSVTWHRDGLPRGLYFLQVVQDGRINFSQKVIVMD